jgi:hypothetical protein
MSTDLPSGNPPRRARLFCDFSHHTGVTRESGQVTNRVELVDAHLHQWDPFTTPRAVSAAAKIARRAPALTPALRRLFPRSARDFIGDPRHLLNPYLPADYVADASAAGVGTVVHIEADWQAKDPSDTGCESVRNAGASSRLRGGRRAWTLFRHVDLRRSAA